MRDLAARSTRRKSAAPGSARAPGAAASSAARPMSPAAGRFDQWNKAKAGPAGAKSGDARAVSGEEDEDVLEELIVARRPSAVALAAAKAAATGEKEVRSEDEAGEAMKWGQLSGLLKKDQMLLTCYMPDRKPLSISVEPTATASDVIVAALAAHKRSQLLVKAASGGEEDNAGLKYDRPELYCLMMHDGDGLPDDVAVRNGH